LIVDYFSTVSNGTDRALKVVDALPLNTWTHVIFTFDGTAQTEKIYINNVLQTVVDASLSSLGTVPSILNAANGQSFRVGHRGATGNTVGSWAGGIDDVMVFNETLAYSRAGSATGTGSTLVPEPSTVFLAAFGLALVSIRRRVQHEI
jgi:hypothetical protein